MKTTPRRSPRRTPLAAAARIVVPMLLVALAGELGAAPNPFRKSPYRKGQPVTVHGRVTDAEGRSLGGVTVIFTVSRNAFRLLKMSREESGSLQVPVVADAEGLYRLDWRWDPYYNTFVLAVAVPVRRNGHDTFEIFHQIEITSWIRQSNPAEIALVVPDATALEELLAFLASLDSEDEKRVYHEMGRPDRVDEGRAHYDPDRTWWYFEAGKVYRFEDDKLDQVAEFEPVPSAVED